jgi:hypothetical protein
MLERSRVWFTLFLVIGLLFLVAGLRADDGQLAGSDLSDQVQTPSLEISQFEAKISELEKISPGTGPEISGSARID